MFFICVLKSRHVHTQMLSVLSCKLSFGDDFGVAVLFLFIYIYFFLWMFLVLSRHYSSVATVALPHWSNIFITVQSSSSFTVRIGRFVRPIQMSKTFSCLFLLSFMLTLPLHEVMTPLFFFLFLIFFFFSFFFNGSCPLLCFVFFSILSHLPFSPFYFADLFVFWRQQVGIDQGDIPDLSQVSVHLTFHFHFLCSFAVSHSFSYFPTFSPLSDFPSTPHGFITPSVLSSDYSHHISPLHIPVPPPPHPPIPLTECVHPFSLLRPLVFISAISSDPIVV